MRISVSSDDPGYATFREARAARRIVRVLLDGVPVEHVITADEDQGFVVTLALRDGRPAADMVRHEPLLTTRFGNVDVVISERAA